MDSLRKKVGNFIAGNDTSQQAEQQSKGKHTPLPVDPYPYPGLRFDFHFVTVDVTTVGQSKYKLSFCWLFQSTTPDTTLWNNLTCTLFNVA